MKTSEKMWLIIGAVITALLVLAFLPILFLWVLNTLFPLALAYTFKTWLASALFLALIVQKT